MRRYLVALLCALALNYSAAAQTLHAFLLCKTNDPDAGMRDVQLMNFNNVDAFCAQLADALGYQYAPHPLLGTSFNSRKARELLTAKTEANDVIVLYYGSHGARTVEMTNFVPRVDIPPEWVTVYDNYQTMCDRHARFVLTLVDACNGVAPLPPDRKQAQFIHESSLSSAPAPLVPLNPVRMQQLFWNSNVRSLVITACKPGLEALGIPSIGSVFTNCFIKAVNDFAQLKTADPVAGGWSRLLQTCAQATHDESLSWLKSEDQAYSPCWDSLARFVMLSPAFTQAGMQKGVFDKLERQSADYQSGNSKPAAENQTAAREVAGTRMKQQSAGQQSAPNSPADDTTIVRGYILQAACQRRRSLPGQKQWYQVDLTVGEPAAGTIDSVEYFLHYSMPRPRVMIESPENHFTCAFRVYADYPVKARLYLKGGRRIDVYLDSLLNACQP